METWEKEQILQNNLNHTIFSWSKQAGLDPMNVERGEGVYFFDRDGKKYIDFSSQLVCMNLGHNNQSVQDAIVKQMGEISYVFPGAATKVRGELGKKISEIAPGSLNKTFFTLGGADSIENAIKIARVYTGRHKVIAQYRSYHGSTYGAMSACGDPRRHAIDSQQSPNFIHVENPYFYRCPWDTNSPEECGRMCAEQVERVIQYEGPESIAAVILEGESGSSGCIKYPPGYWARIKEIADRYGILIIDDEVMSGFGRTGKWFAVENHGVEPDIICMAKGLTGGFLPLGGVIVKDEIAAKFNDIPIPIGLTYSAHPVSCAAALAAIKVYEEEDLINRAGQLGEYVEQKVEQLKAKHPSIGDFRNTGLLGCIELVKNRDTKESLVPWNAKPEGMGPVNEVISKLRELGLFTLVRWNFIFIAPPLIITETQIDEGLEIISQALEIADRYYEG